MGETGLKLAFLKCRRLSMEIGKTYHLKNGDTIVIQNLFRHYLSNKSDYEVINQRGQTFIIHEDELASLLRKQRTTAEKLSLYARYFTGRPDVYAQKWSNGKGWSPALKNWWDFYELRNNPTAQKQLTKEYKPFSNKTIYDQLVSSDAYHRYGIYPLLKGDTTKLLVFDLDKHGSSIDPVETTLAILNVCHKYRITCLPEVSHSGNSYHLWIFFSEPVNAAIARNLGKLILIEAMSTSDQVDISCFDRLVPNQDRLPNKGFGNLIALPLKWSDVQENRSVFTDDDLKPLPATQQWDRLESTKRYSASELDQLIKKIMANLKILKTFNNDLDLISIQQFPKEVTGEVRGEILINRSPLTRQEQVTLLGLATFVNPEFKKKQYMRMPVWNVPSLLTAGQITKRYLHLPRGVLKDLQQHCKCHLIDHFTKATLIKTDFKGKLRPQQRQAVTSIGNHYLGMICAHTGFVKTVVGCALIAKRQARTLVIVPTENIAKQWQQTCLKFLNIQETPFEERTGTGRLIRKKKVELISGKRNRPSHLVDIVNYRKLARMSAEDRRAFYQNYGQIIIDECHHISAVTFEKVLVQANVKFIVGLTATPERKDSLEKFMHYRCGQICFSGSSEEQLIPRYLYVRYTGMNSFSDNTNYAQKINNLVSDDSRNNQIVDDLMQAISEKRHILLLSDRIKHLTILNDLLKKKECQNVYLITGSSHRQLAMPQTSDPFIILSTNKYVGEGFDLKTLDTLFLVLPFSWMGNTKQYLGRLERGLDNKDELRVYDYVDIADDTFAKMFQKRVRVYKKLNYEFVKSSQWNSYESTFYVADNYRSVWKHDLLQAKNIFLRLKHFSMMQVKLINDLNSSDCEIILEVSEDTSDQLIQKLAQTVKISKRESVGNNICIIDQQIYWYGDLNFGGHSYSGASGIRIVNRKLAQQTLKIK